VVDSDGACACSKGCEILGGPTVGGDPDGVDAANAEAEGGVGQEGFDDAGLVEGEERVGPRRRRRSSRRSLVV
jgi:hypothetical protein